MRTSSCTSSVLSGNTTASGGSLGIQVVVLACCSRTARDVTSRLPNFAVRAVIAAAVALELRVPPALISSTAILHSHYVRNGITMLRSRTRGAWRAEHPEWSGLQRALQLAPELAVNRIGPAAPQGDGRDDKPPEQRIFPSAARSRPCEILESRSPMRVEDDKHKFN